MPSKKIIMFDPELPLIDQYIRIIEDENDLNVSRVLGSLKEEAFREYLFEGVIEVPEDPQIQRIHINNYLRLKLGLLGSQTIRVRMALMNTGPFENNLRIFREEVIPCFR